MGISQGLSVLVAEILSLYVNSILQELGLAHPFSPAPGAGLAEGPPEPPLLNE